MKRPYCGGLSVEAALRYTNPRDSLGEDAEQKIAHCIQQRKNMLVLCECSLQSLPSNFGCSLSFVTYLDISHNGLCELPPSIGNIVHLTKLYSNNNQLDKIPPELGSLDNLLCLYLENNQLTEIPHALLRLGLNRVGRSSFHCDLANNPLLQPTNVGLDSARSGNWINDLKRTLDPRVNGVSLVGKELDRWQPLPCCPKLLELTAAAFSAATLPESERLRASKLLPPDLEWYLQQGSTCSDSACSKLTFAPMGSKAFYSFRYSTLLCSNCTPRIYMRDLLVGTAFLSLRLSKWHPL
jgi:hypothetical protein